MMRFRWRNLALVRERPDAADAWIFEPIDLIAGPIVVALCIGAALQFPPAERFAGPWLLALAPVLAVLAALGATHIRIERELVTICRRWLVFTWRRERLTNEAGWHFAPPLSNDSELCYQPLFGAKNFRM